MLVKSMFPLNIWIASFVLYSLLRIPDVESTRRVLAELDPELHEVNFLIPPLLKKIGFNKTMIVTWLVFATVIASLDAVNVYPVVGFPILWLLFGLFHLLAAANNVQLYFYTMTVGAEAVEENTKRIIATLKKLPFFEKIVFLIRMNFFNLVIAIYGVIALVLFTILLSSTEIYLKGPIPYMLLLGPPIMIIDLIMFFPTLVFGSLIISWRRLKIANDKEAYPEKNQRYLTISIECLENALNEAKTTSAEYVKFVIPLDE